MKKPASNEHPKFMEHYISLVEEGDLEELMRLDLERSIVQLEDLSEEQSYFSYDEGKWTIRQLMMHLIDTERVFSYRILRMLREDNPSTQGFDENEWADMSRGENREWIDILEEFFHVRESTIALVANLSDSEAERMGSFSGSPVSVRALSYAIIGHCAHHRKVLQERYLNRL